MENAICGRLALSPNHVFNSKSVFDGFQYAQSQSSMFISNVDLIRALTKCRDKHSLPKGPCTNRSFLMAISASGPGKGGLLERPVIEKVTPGRESEFDLR
ncbi:ATP-dependent Clp protease adapter protein CLPS1, chloroplastic [Vitis vinifera]|uniref:ATP-dependent Clp protease adapter protein CLPS1, chloroplastic n=1 Tax=Vitis vinifera TaxID=29760 RepID=A0A438ECR5_VITVI|nr:ATP-dependent Clp protease adapter protein CLPS1, chloroplastic [Vitis vinifera]